MDISYYKDKYEPIDGKWYINKEIGRGAFGSVYEIERRDYGEKSALKIITVPSSPHEVEAYKQEHYTQDEQSVTSYFYGFVEEFEQEFKFMTKLKGNSNIVSVEDYDVKKHRNEIGWDILIRMELLTPMNVYFAQNTLTKKDVIKLGIDICKALEVCEEYNIIHRDLKPSNIFISPRGDFKLGDFGVARKLEKTSSGLSKKGTYTYMAPEVYRGEEYGANVDIYSLGIVMYKLLNDDNEPFRMAMTHQDEENALSRRMKGDVIPSPKNADEELSRIVLKACSFNPKDRYSNPTELRNELEIITTDNSAVLPEMFQRTHGATDKTEGIFQDGKGDELSGKITQEKTIGIFDEQMVEESTEDEDHANVENGLTEENCIESNADEIKDAQKDDSITVSVRNNEFNYKIISISLFIGINLLCGVTLYDPTTLPGAIFQFIYILTYDFAADPQIPVAVVSVLLFVIVCVNLICNIVLKNKKSKEKGLKMFNKILPYVVMGLTVLSFVFGAITLKINCSSYPEFNGDFTWSAFFGMTRLNFIYLAVFVVETIWKKCKRLK